MAPDIAIGIDLGGTNVRVGAVNEGGKLLAIHQLPIEPLMGVNAGIYRIKSLVEKTLDTIPDARVMGIGLGATGPVDREKGTIENPYTLPGWEGFPIRTTLSENYKVPVFMENDADAAALGEYWIGSGQNSNRLVAVTIGTGVGMALIIEGKIYRGMDGTHPEGGHQLIDPSGPACYCGAHGCWESLVSGPAIASAARKDRTGLSSSTLLALVGGDDSRIDARLVLEAASAGDSYSLSIVAKVAEYIGIGLINIITLFVPDMIVLSGGVMKSIDVFMPVINKMIATHNIMVPACRVNVLPAKLGYNAGLIGAAYLVIKKVPEGT